MHLSVRIGLLLGTLGMPFMILAAPPSVGNVRATVEDSGAVTVTWDAVDDPSVVRYHVFYSFESILENDGLYDDFEETDGAVTTHSLLAPPAVDTLYVSVLAVNAAGDESSYFVNEASVNLRQARTENGTLRLLKAESVSATGVLLTFSHTLIAPQTAEGIFTIRDAADAPLGLTRLMIRTNTATLFTQPQGAGAYSVRVDASLRGTGDNGPLALDANQAPVLFLGGGTTTGAATSTSSNADVQELSLSTERAGDGSVTVAASWQQVQDDRVRGYRVAQSNDGGRTYRADTSVRREINGIRITNAFDGPLTVRVQALFADGSVSAGVMQTVQVLAAQQTVAPVTGSVLTQNGALSNSGSTITLFALVLAGVLSGILLMRRKLSLA